MKSGRLEPNVYYIPPIHAPTVFLHQMFGPGVSRAIETYRTAPDDALLAGLLGLFGCTERVVPRFKQVADAIAGLAEDGTEILRVPIREPVFVRKAFDAKQGVVRTNCP